jgi:hypothetical protein
MQPDLVPHREFCARIGVVGKDDGLGTVDRLRLL